MWLKPNIGEGLSGIRADLKQSLFGRNQGTINKDKIEIQV
jgi:hypothetical protein